MNNASRTPRCQREAEHTYEEEFVGDAGKGVDEKTMEEKSHSDAREEMSSSPHNQTCNKSTHVRMANSRDVLLE